MENGEKKMVVMEMLKEVMLMLVSVLRLVSVVGLWRAGGKPDKVNRTLSFLFLSISVGGQTDRFNTQNLSLYCS